jgi:hypothetical protein
VSQGEGGGRPFIEIDLAELEKLCRLNCTVEEVAAFFGVSKRTIEYRIENDPQFKELIEQGRANGKLSVRRKQFHHLEDDNVPMAIFLGKVLLGQRETTEQVNEHQPIQIEIINPYDVGDDSAD